ncbi:lytic transglycosylase domain-containing protein [Acidithiobacillus ferrooxidans]|uniref:Lytic transglycosylase n=1 Tax=Acidithiobacillus ferrooxidans TaxID=920 RepID=A0A2W1K5C3_ACIFR|nr:lytic transglycosylase domain-containing protein [Acidithiobacillus ferrooxidans]MCR1341890.1 lytic transglycosylase domain-containing protein [Acidithiobacillus ferrooxidans]PZD81873.1 lytic transglycosylase [Acidithiobacillus ferrooxidans]QLK41837.1 lytic transglycosylase domain-containing protein [Acidithiobacillus ferrooxidans]QZT53791.1 lytic transglycosylase domain-containing protein [Acidithiobacillus ferrooxidans]RRN85222.1 MAG: lytic transglycosylase [Acidithiobacillus ferrooxidans
MGTEKRQQDEVAMIGLALLQQCAPQVAPVTMAAIVQAESGGWPWTIDVNDLPDGSMRFNDQQAAVTAAVRYIRMGYKVDMGIAQIDSENLSWLGLSVTNVFNPCANLQAAQRILVGAYHQAGANGPESLDGAFQAYNSGNTSGDGHYARVVYHQAGVIVPTIPGGQLAPWATRPVGGVEGVEKEGGTSAAPIRPVIMMPPKSWQPLAKGEDFSVVAKMNHADKQSITSIWTPAMQ